MTVREGILETPHSWYETIRDLIVGKLETANEININDIHDLIEPNLEMRMHLTRQEFLGSIRRMEELGIIKRDGPIWIKNFQNGEYKEIR